MIQSQVAQSFDDEAECGIIHRGINPNRYLLKGGTSASTIHGSCSHTVHMLSSVHRILINGAITPAFF